LRRAADRVVRLAAEAARAEAALAAAASAVVAASGARAQAEAAAWAEAASTLAATLAEGEPCAVCGSLHHPSPARPPGHAATDLDALRTREEAARATERQAQAAQSRLGAERASAEAERDALARRIGAPEPEEQLAATLAATRASLAEAEAARIALPALMAAADAAAAEEATLAAESHRAAEALRAAEDRHARATGAHTALRDQVPAEARDATALAGRISAARATSRTLREALARDRAEHAAAGAAREAAQASAAAAEARRGEAAGAAEAASSRFRDACTRAGFAGPDAARAARLGEDNVATLEAALRAYGERRAAARETAAATAAAAATLTPPDIALREAEAAEAAHAAHAAGTAEGMARAEAEAAAARLGRLRAADDAFAEARARFDSTAAIATVARGQNDKRMSFEHFVLASLLDEALAAANDHLSRMLAGRFRLSRREEPGRANARAGLDIAVFDEWTGQARPAGTLSGGEGFCAALALALGLSETVQAHAGARRIDALLIDEGFGSLDEEALDKAMDVLSTLPGSDRIVGIISHVGELKQRIAARLEVSPGVRGSTARFVLG
jgi:exonuclease SbcC